MKKVLCLILSLVFIVGICVSAPITLKATAASVEDLTIITPSEDQMIMLDYYGPNSVYGETGYNYSYYSSYSGSYPYSVRRQNQRYYNGVYIYDFVKNKITPRYIIACNREAKGVLQSVGSAVVIAESAFENCKYLTSIDTSGIYDIREYAFAGCTSLENVILSTAQFRDSNWLGAILYIREGMFLNCSSLKTVNIPSQVTQIHKYAFKNCSSLEELTIPENVTILEEAAFMGCSSLKEINLNNNTKILSEYLFADCTSLESVVIPEGVKTIKAFAFSGCTSLKSITIPSTVTSIDASAFYNCPALTDIIVSEENEYYSVDDGVLFNINKSELVRYSEAKTDVLYIIPETVTKIGDYSFAGNKKLEILTIPAGVEEIAETAFNYCENIKTFSVSSSNLNYSANDNVLFNKDKTELIKYCIGSDEENYSISSKVTVVKSNAFANAVNLKNVKIPRGVTTIGEEVFYNCSELETITIPSTVTTIGNSAFENCTNLNNVEMSENIISIGNKAFKNCIVLKNMTFPNTLESLGEEAFYGCSLLETVALSENLTILNNALFEKCVSLKEVTIPLSVTSIGSNVFAECLALEEIIIPDKVESIGEKAFSKSNNIKSVTIPESVTEIASNAFEYCYSDLILFGVKGSYTETYAKENSLIFIDESEKVSSELYRFELNEDEKSYSLISCDVSAMGQALIPLEYEGLPVTHITEDAFCNCKSIVSVTIPENIVSIGDSSFLGCSSIQKLNIPNSVKIIEDNAFSQCTGIKTVKLVNGLEYIGNNSFSECSSIEAITIPDSVKSIGENAFFMCSNLTAISVSSSNSEFLSDDGVLFNKDKTELIKYPEGKSAKEYITPETVTDIAVSAFANSKLELVSLPDLLVEIKDSVFKNCCNIKKLTISANVTNIALNSFDGCDSLETIEVEEGNENYTSIDGVLFNADKNKLVKYPVNKIDKQYNIPSGVTEICKYAFNDCDKLESVNMPDTLKTIDDYAFLNCDLIYVMSVPKSVENIGAFAMGYYDNDGIQRSELTIYGNLESEAEAYASIHSFGFKNISEVYNVNIYVKNENQMLVTDPLYEIKIEEIVEPAEEYTTEYVASQSYEDKSFLGTGSKVNIYDKNGNLVKQHIIVVKGDVNGDSVCDALDLMLVELAQHSHNNVSLEGAYLLAGDLAENGSITIEDFEAMVNRAIA